MTGESAHLELSLSIGAIIVGGMILHSWWSLTRQPTTPAARGIYVTQPTVPEPSVTEKPAPLMPAPPSTSVGFGVPGVALRKRASPNSIH